MSVKEDVSLPAQRICTRCNFVSSQAVCKACVLLEGLNKGLPKLGIGKSSKAKKMLDEYNSKQQQNTNTLAEVITDLEDLNTSKSKDVCKSKKIDVNGVNKSANSKCGKRNCCSNKTNLQDTEEETNTKLNHLLEEYGLDDKDNCNLNDSENGIQDSDDEVTLINGQQEDDTCSSSCGTAGLNF